MLQTPPEMVTGVIVVACLGLASVVMAQETDADRYGEFDEVLVISDPVEVGTGPGAEAGREQLDISDQIDMSGFFDDIDEISTLGGDDEGNPISIDGLSPELVKVVLDGHSVGEGRRNGGFGPGDITPDMILRVDVYKTPAASEEEGGAGGLVNLRMRAPLNIPKAATSLSARLGYVPDNGEFSPSGSFFMARRSDNKKFGYTLSMSASDRPRETDSQGISSWALRELEDVSVFIPTQVKSNADDMDQRSLFAGLVLGVRPRPSLDINGKILLSEKQKDIESHSLQHRLERQRNILPLAFDERIVTALESSDDSRSNLRTVGSTREDLTDSVLLGIDLTWRHADWQVDGAVGRNTFTNKSAASSQSIIFAANSAFDYIANGDGSLVMSYPGGFPPNDDFSASRVNLSDRKTTDRTSFGAVDLVRDMGDRMIRRIKFGARITEMTSSRRNSRGLVNLDDDLWLSGYAGGRTEQTPWDTTGWPAVDMRLVNSLVHESPIAWEDNLLNQYDIEQRSGAGYLQADFRASRDGDRFLIGNVGVRMVGTDTRVSGYQDFGEGPAPITLKNDYSDILPGLRMRMRVADRASLTLGVSRVITRPAFNSLAPGIRLNFAERTGRSGNPDLQPFRANQYLTELVWSPERGSRLSGEIAYRDVDSYFALAEEAVEIDDDIFLVTRPINGDNGSIFSTSLKVDQQLRALSTHLQDFALSVSYTRNRSETELPDPYTGKRLPMPNTADNVMKATLSYSKETFAGKLRYQRRGESLKSPLSESGLSIWNQPTGGLDLNLSWKVTQHTRFNIDARNLVSEDQVQSTDDSGQLLRIGERDRSLSATLRARW